MAEDVGRRRVRDARGSGEVEAVNATYVNRILRLTLPAPDTWLPPRPRVDNAMIKALARAFRWRKMLDDGVHATLEDLARAKGVHATYVSRVLRLTLLAP